MKIHEEFNKMNRFSIAHTEQEIDVIIQTSVFCVDKTCFLRPDHIAISLELELIKMKITDH